MGGLVQPLSQHIAQFVKLVYHRRDNHPDNSTDDTNGKQHGYDDRQSSHLNVQLVFYELDYRIK